MGDHRQSVRFTSGFDGVRLAYAVCGRGYPLVRVPMWISHVEHDWQSPVMRHVVVEMASRHLLLSYDCRGVGMSERDVSDMSFDAWVDDLEAVVDAAGLQRFALWGTEEPAFRQVFTSLMVPGGTAEQWRWFTDKMRTATSPQTALRILRLWQQIDVCHLARQLRCPSLVLHSRDDAIVPYEEGKLMAALIPGAEFVTLNSANHLILEQEPAWPQLRAELRRFLPVPVPAEVPDPSVGFDELTAREREVLELIARGLCNDEIAQQLAISQKTVRNHITSIFGKLAAITRAQAIVRARRAGFGSATQ